MQLGEGLCRFLGCRDVVAMGSAKPVALVRRFQLYSIDRDTVHQAALTLVVVKRIVPGRPIVPEGDRALLPFKAGLKLWPRGVLVEKIQERLALFLGPT